MGTRPPSSLRPYNPPSGLPFPEPTRKFTIATDSIKGSATAENGTTVAHSVQGDPVTLSSGDDAFVGDPASTTDAQAIESGTSQT